MGLNDDLTSDLQKFYENDIARLKQEAAQQKALEEANKSVFP